MHIQTLTKMVRQAWILSEGNYDVFLLNLECISEELADAFEDKQLKREVFISLHMGNFTTAIRAVL